MTEYVYVSRTAGMLANGRPLGKDDVVELSEEDEKDPHNKDLIATGALVAEDKLEEEQEKAAGKVEKEQEKAQKQQKTSEGDK